MKSEFWIRQVRQRKFGAVKVAAKALRRRMKLANSTPYWRKLKDAYACRRGFVIGNGPSLRISDLDLLTDEICVASNKVYLAFPETRWRPNILSIADPLVWQKIHDVVGNHVDTVHIPTYLEPLPCSARVVYWKALGLAGAHSDEPPHFSSSLETGAYGGCTVTYENLQIAVHLGLNPVYVIGCDHYYAGENDVERDKPVQTNSQNHFIKNYRLPGEIVNPAPIAEMNAAYQQARLFSNGGQVKIYNATRGGQLEAFERADLDEVLRK